MLKFFYRSWTELADDDPDWLLPGEEADAPRAAQGQPGLHARRHRARGGQPRSSTACARARPRARRTASRTCSWTTAHCLSRASQLLAELAAEHVRRRGGRRLPRACGTFDSYPYAAGLDEFAERHPRRPVSCSWARAGAAGRRRARPPTCWPIPAFEGRVASPPSDGAEEGALAVLASERPRRRVRARGRPPQPTRARSGRAGRPAWRSPCPTTYGRATWSAALEGARAARRRRCRAANRIGGDARDPRALPPRARADRAQPGGGPGRRHGLALLVRLRRPPAEQRRVRQPARAGPARSRRRSPPRTAGPRRTPWACSASRMRGARGLS